VMPFSPRAPVVGGKRQVSNEGGLGPSWSRNGRELFYQSLGGRVQVATYAVKGDSFQAERPRFWSEKKILDFDVAPDGKRVLALLDADDAKPETHLRLLLNVGDELRRRAAAGAAK
jgi:hypothetical protein